MKYVANRPAAPVGFSVSDKIPDGIYVDSTGDYAFVTKGKVVAVFCMHKFSPGFVDMDENGYPAYPLTAFDGTLMLSND